VSENARGARFVDFTPLPELAELQRAVYLGDGKKFLSEYQAAGYAEPSAAYGGYSYDAAKAIIAGLKSSLASAADAKSARTATIDAVGKVSFDGVTGKVAFDQYGDSTSKVLTVYKVDSGKWVAAKTDTFK